MIDSLMLCVVLTVSEISGLVEEIKRSQQEYVETRRTHEEVTDTHAHTHTQTHRHTHSLQFHPLSCGEPWSERRRSTCPR